MLTPREKSPIPENFPRGGSNLRRCEQRAQTLPTSNSGPQIVKSKRIKSTGMLIVTLFQTPLYNAVCLGKRRLVEAMLTLGADVNRLCRYEARVS